MVPSQLAIDLALLCLIVLCARQAKFDAWAIVCAVIYADQGSAVLPALLMVSAFQVLFFRFVARSFWDEKG